MASYMLFIGLKQTLYISQKLAEIATTLSEQVSEEVRLNLQDANFLIVPSVRFSDWHLRRRNFALEIVWADTTFATKTRRQLVSNR